MLIDQKLEARRVYTACYHARRAGVPATLTLSQWLQILTEHEGACAYCSAPFNVLDHVAGLGAGTTAANSLPACCRCNALKGTDPAFEPPPRQTLKERRDTAVWQDWSAQGREWTPASVVGYCKGLFARGWKASSVYQRLGQLNRIAVAHGFPSVLASSAVKAFRHKLYVKMP